MNRSSSLLFIILVAGVLALAFLLRPVDEAAAVIATANTITTIPGESPVALSGARAPLDQGTDGTLMAQPSPTEAFASVEPMAIPDSVRAADLQDSSAINNNDNQPPESSVEWSPPAYEVPLARHPNDHYWMIRPVAANFRNSGLPYYPYGSNGPANNLRVHHGVDISNPVGVNALAAAPGRVIWADEGHYNEFEAITSYGNTVVIEHDFGYRGQRVYTLYAHLAVILVSEGQQIETGDVVGLIGSTGQVTGPHVHFEVRIGENRYGAVRNPELWMAPYIGTGVVAGRIETPTGDLAFDAEIELFSYTKGYVTLRTTTYAGQSVEPDDLWNENFVLADVPEGNYRVTAIHGETVWTGEVLVQPGVTNWVEMVIDPEAQQDSDS